MRGQVAASAHPSRGVQGTERGTFGGRLLAASWQRLGEAERHSYCKLPKLSLLLCAARPQRQVRLHAGMCSACAVQWPAQAPGAYLVVRLTRRHVQPLQVMQVIAKHIQRRGGHLFALLPACRPAGARAPHSQAPPARHACPWAGAGSRRGYRHALRCRTRLHGRFREAWVPQRAKAERCASAPERVAG